MSEPTKEALELAERINERAMLPAGVVQFTRFDQATAATVINKYTASLREELRAAREALEPLAMLGVAKQETECSLQSMNTPFWDCPPDLVLFDDRMGNVITVLDVRRARAACKGGDAV